MPLPQALNTRRAAETILPRAILLRQSITLDKPGRLPALYPVEAEVHHAADSSLNACRTAASEHLSEEGKAVIVNYLREGLEQQWAGITRRSRARRHSALLGRLAVLRQLSPIQV
jgi:hypothetical protein